MKRPDIAPRASSALTPQDSLVVRTLLAAARQRPGLDEARCQLVFDCLATAAAVRELLRESLAHHSLNELKFAILVVLFTLEPESSTTADLAAHAGVKRAAVADALDGLQEQNLVTRQRDAADRRSIDIRLTQAGRRLIDAALQRYLQTAGHVARFVERTGQAATAVVCAQLRLGSGGAA